MSLKDGAGERIRTLDPRITSAPLYQLSYAGLYRQPNYGLPTAILTPRVRKVNLREQRSTVIINQIYYL